MNKEKATNNLKRERSTEDFISPATKLFKSDIEMKSMVSPVSLATDFTGKDNTLLPFSYAKLLDIFISLDFSVNKLINKGETLYIDRVTKVMQQMNKNDFSATVFGQILFVFPESYHYKFDNTPVKLTRHYRATFQIMPNLSFGEVIDSSPRKTMSSLSVKQLLLRRNVFREKLLTIVKEKHDEFLINVKKMKEEDVKKLKVIRWCSDFDLTAVGNIPSITYDKTKKSYPEQIPKSFCKDLFSSKCQKKEVVEDLCEQLVKKSNIDDCVVLKENVNQTPDKLKERILIKSKKNKTQSQLLFNVSVGEAQIETVFSSSNKEQSSLQKQKLPFHLKALFELFINVDKAVHSLYTRGDIVYLSTVLKIVSLTNTYKELHFCQLLTVYPDAYKLRWERVLNKLTMKASSKLDIVITPLLKNDGTAAAITSPDKGYIKFDCVRLKQRCQRFMDSCLDIVKGSYKRYLMTTLTLSEQEAERELMKGNWEASFNADKHVDMVQASSLPMKPLSKDGGDQETKIKSIADMFKLIKKRNEEETKDVEKSTSVVNEKLKSIPQSLLDRVKQNKNNRYLFAKNNIDAKRRLILERLPRFYTVILTEFRGQSDSKRPLEKKSLVSTVCRNIGISVYDFDEHLAVLNEVAPGCVELLNWTPPSLKLGTSPLSLVDIQTKLTSLLKG